MKLQEETTMVRAIKTACAILIGGVFAFTVAAYADSESGGVFFGGADSESGGVQNEWGVGSQSGGVQWGGSSQSGGVKNEWGIGSQSGGAAQEWGLRSQSGGPLDSGAETQSGGVPERAWGSGAESDAGGETVWGSEQPVG